MNKLVIPPSPNWYETSILACAPDNTLIYGARNDLVLMENSDDCNQASNINIISRAHSQKILSVHINRNWGNPNKYVVSLSEDKIIKVWNAETLKKHATHNEHLAHSKVVGANFAGDDRIISVSEEGIIVVWSLGANKTNVLKNVFGFKVTVTCLSTCPHAPWLTAFGLKNGLVLVTDLRKTGTLLHKLRGHDKPVLSLSWCPAPINIFPQIPGNSVGAKKDIATDSKSASNSDTEIHTSESEHEEAATRGSQDQNVTESKDEYNPNYNTHPLLEVYDSNDEDSCQVFQDLKDKILETNTPEVGEDNHIEHAFHTIDENELKDNKMSPTKVLSKDTSDLHDSDNFKIQDFLKECEDLECRIEKVKKESDVLVASTSKYENPFRILCSDIPIEKVCDEEKQELDIKIKLTESPEGIGNLSVESKNEMSEIDEQKTVSITYPKISSDECENVDQNQRIDEEVAHQGKTKEVCVDVGPEVKMSNIITDMKTCEDIGRQISTRESVEEPPRKEYLLASSAREGNIYIWRAGSDGRMQNFMCVPNNNKTSYRKSSSFDKIWITLCWASPTVLLSSSKSSELLQWNLPKPMDKSKHMTLIHKDHNTMLFSIAAPISYSNEFNWTSEKQMNAWTLGQDRLLLNTSLCSEKTNLACYPTLGGTIHCMRLSPVDPNRLAIGSSDGHIRVWDLSRPHVKQIIMTTFYQKIQSKVECLAWHPENELLLAFGTSEGRIGYLDSNNTSKSPILLPQFFKSQIYKLEWGPICGNKKRFGLYAVAEGKLVVFDTTKKSENEPVQIDRPEKTFIYSFAWKPDYSMLLVSTKAGFLIVYSPDLMILRKHYLPQRVQDLLWHPGAGRGDGAVPQSCRFAAITNLKNVTVYDFGGESANEGSVVASYEGTSDVVNCISWSPHRDSEIVIGNENGIVQVWDTETKKITSTFVNPNFIGIMTALWSPLDPDFMITGSKDSALRIWRISEHAPKDEIELMAKRKTILNELMKEANDLLPRIEKNKQEPVTLLKKTNKNTLLPKFPVSSAQSLSDLRKLLKWKEEPDSVEVSTESGSELSIFDVFGTSQNMLKLVNHNETMHKQRGKCGLNGMLALFRGDLNSTVKEAIDEKRVDPWIISLAPMVSPKLWQMACETYAQQLSDESDTDPLEAATYFLACHKVEQAIKCFCEAQLFKEALALAKCRYNANDAVVQEVLDKWAKHSVFVGNFEIAAQCFIVLGKYEEAASVLFRRSDIGIMEFAAELAEKSGNVELHKAALFRYKAFLAESNADTVEKESDIATGEKKIVPQNESSNNGTYENTGKIQDESTEDEIKSIISEVVQQVNEELLQVENVILPNKAEEILTMNGSENEIVQKNEGNNATIEKETIKILEFEEKHEDLKNGNNFPDASTHEGMIDTENVIETTVREHSEVEEITSLKKCTSEEMMNVKMCEKEDIEKKFEKDTENKTVDEARKELVEQKNEEVKHNEAAFLVENTREENLAVKEISSLKELAAEGRINIRTCDEQNMETETDKGTEDIAENEIEEQTEGKHVPQNGTACLVPKMTENTSGEESTSRNGSEKKEISEIDTCEGDEIEGVTKDETSDKRQGNMDEVASPQEKRVPQKSSSKNKRKQRKH